MRIKKYNNFKLNESSEIENEDFIRDVFLDFTDDEFQLTFKNVFFDKGLFNREHVSDIHNQPGLIIEIRRKSKNEIKVDNISEMLNNLDECVDRLSDLGRVVINNMKFERDSNYFLSLYLIYEDKEVELSTKEGFYDFFEVIKTIWRRYDNKTTRSFDFKQDKDEVILTPKSEDLNVNMLLPEVKKQLKKFFDPWYQAYKNRTSHEYTYDIKVIDNKIHIIYKEAFRINRWGERV